jgi:hypothetical protein
MGTKTNYWQRVSDSFVGFGFKQSARVWSMFTDTYSPQDAAAMAEELGVEVDSPEHLKLEKSCFCNAKVSGPLKRK